MPDPSPTPRQSPAGRKRKRKYPTWEFPVGSGIKIAEMPNKTHGKVFGVSYQVRIPAKLLGTGRREMVQQRTKAEAERLAEDRFLALKKHGTEFSKIPPSAQGQLAQGWTVLFEHNRTQPDGLKLNLIDVIKAGIVTLSPSGGLKTVTEVCHEMVSSKEARHASGGLDGASVRDFKIRTGRFKEKFGGRRISEITHTEILDWLTKLAENGSMFGGPLSRRSVKNYRNTVAEVFRHAVARRYCASNPFDRFTREDLKNLGGESSERNLDDIRALTVEEARKLLRAAHAEADPGQLGALVLRLFCGVRTTEVCQLDWSEVHWLDESPYVHIPANKAKKRRIRHIDIPQNALAWLKLCNPPATGRILPTTGDKQKDAKYYCVRFNRIIKAAGIGREDDAGDWQSDWESNDTRHSFGSYHFALHGDAMRTAGQMGHKQGDEVLFAHYRTLVRKLDAEAFFGLRPEPGMGKIIQFPRAAQATTDNSQSDVTSEANGA